MEASINDHMWVDSPKQSGGLSVYSRPHFYCILSPPSPICIILGSKEDAGAIAASLHQTSLQPKQWIMLFQHQHTVVVWSQHGVRLCVAKHFERANEETQERQGVRAAHEFGLR